MEQQFKSNDPKSILQKTIQKYENQYGFAYIKCAIIKENNEYYLYQADIKIQHKNDVAIKKTIYNYDEIILAVIPLTIKELKKIINELNLGKINLKSLPEIKAKNSFDKNYCNIYSQTQYNGFYYDWPCYCFRASLNENIIMKNISSSLTKPGLPAYPNFYEACDSFFQHEHVMMQYTPININFLIPNYDARIETLVIADNQISAMVKSREVSMNDCIIQVFCKNGIIQSQNSPDLQLDDNGTAKFHADFMPDSIFVYLLNSKNGEALDSKIFSPLYMPGSKGVLIKTSAETLEEIIVKGENQYVEFKYDLGKQQNEFLESVIAFANTNDGKILLGIDDDGKVVGFYDDFDKIDKKIHGLINSWCEPDIEFNIEQIDLEKPIILIKVKEGKNKPYLLVGKSAYKRVDENDRVFKRLDFDMIFREREDKFVRQRKNYR